MQAKLSAACIVTSSMLLMAAPARQRVLAAYGNLPLTFEASGPTGGRAKFVSRGPGYNVFLTPTGAVLSNGVSIALLGANPAPKMEGLEPAAGVSNYLDRNPAKQRIHVSRYAKVRYHAVYPGVDLDYYGNGRNFEHDFVVAPGADPRRIRFAITGTDRIDLASQGDLAIRTAEGEVRLRKPTIYQNAVNTGARRQIAGTYKVAHGNQVSFELAVYDSTLPLVIDPVLIYSTYLGGGVAERFPAIVVDIAGNAFISGSTASLDFPTANALQPKHGTGAGANTFITKLDPAGKLLFSTYLGGATFQGGNIALDRAGNVYVASSPSAGDNPVTQNAFQRTYGGGANDAWIGKLSPDGSKLLYGTYLGGSGRDRVLALAVDAQGNAVVAGETMSSDFPTVNAAQPNLRGTNNAWVAQLNADGSKLNYSTYLGGSADDRAFWITLDLLGNAYVVGRTSSADFPVVNALQKTYGGGPDDAFLVNLSPSGRVVFATFLGGSGDDSASGVGLDAAGNIYVTGATNSPNFPTRNALQPTLGGGTCGTPARLCLDAFVAKLKPDGSEFLYSTYLGGTGDDNAIEDTGVIAVDLGGTVYLAGQTSSIDFPTFNALQPSHSGGVTDGFLAQLSPDGSTLIHATYLGGSGADVVSGMAIDGGGNVYLAGHTASTDFPLWNAAQGTFGGLPTDATVTKVGPAPAYFAVSSANRSAPLAVESLASLFGPKLAEATEIGDARSASTSLGGISLRVTDSRGISRLAPLFYVSPSQINFEVPDGTAPGDATLEVVGGTLTIPRVTVPIRSLAPGLFTLPNNNAAAYGVRVEVDGSQTVLPPGGAITLDTRVVELVLFGTGLRYRSSLANVKCTIGGIAVPVEYAGPGGGVPGLDQVNVRLTPALKGNTDGHLVLTVDGIVANVVMVDVH